MKHTKKFVSLLLTLVMVLAMAGTTFAAQEGPHDGGSITINDAVPGQTYKAYQILYLESYNATSEAYAYKANSGLAHSIHNEDINIYISAKKHSKDSIFINLRWPGVVHRIYRL